jgi:hypothetical protein
MVTMPKVDPETGEPMTDDPEAEAKDQRGGKQGHDLQDGANPTGSPTSTTEWDTPEKPNA